jgi:hypothetical protein
MKKTPSIIDTYYKSLGTKIFRDTTALPFADGGPLNDRNIHGDLLPSVYASALGRYYGNGGNLTSEECGPGLRWDEATKSCVPLIIVEDENDPRYQEYLERKKLYEYSQLPSHNVKQVLASDLANGYTAKSYVPFDAKKEYDDWAKNVSPELLNDLEGPYGSAAVKKLLTPEEFAKWKKGIPGTNSIRTPEELESLIAKYPPSRYETRESQIDDPWSFRVAVATNNQFTTPNTNFLEDKIDRIALKKIYPGLTDEEINKWVTDSRTEPSYVSNQKDSDGSHQWIVGPGKDETTTYEDGSTETSFIPTKFSKFNPPPSYVDPNTKIKGYYPDSIIDKFAKDYSYLPVWDAPTPVEYISNEPIPPLIPDRLPVNNYELRQGTPGPTVPEYNTPGYKMDIPSYYKAHHNSSQLIPHARLKRSETDARVTTPFAKLTQKVTGYNPQTMEGYEEEEGNWVPGEIEQAQQENRRIQFQGLPTLQDRKNQQEYNAAFDQYDKYQNQKEIAKKIAENYFIPKQTYGSGGQMKPDYSLPEDSFQQGGNGLKNSVYASSMGQYPAPYAMGGAMNQYPDGGPIYTYAKRPGSYYQKDENGQWLISNKGTGGQYVPVDDPSGQRTAALNKGAVVTMANPTADKYSNVAPSYDKSPMVQSVAGRTEAERQPVENDIYAQNFMSQMRKDTAESQKNALPQHEQPATPQDWIWTLPMMGGSAMKSAGTAIADGIGALGTKAAPYITGALETSIPGMASVPGATVGNAVAAGFAADAAVNRLPKIPGQISRGEYTDAVANALTGAIDVAGAGVMSPLYQGAKSTASELGKLLNTEDGLLSNAYKVNPFAFKPNPNAYYRGIGEAGMNDALNTGVLRSNRTGTGLTNNTTYDAVFFDKGKTRLADALGNGNIAEVRDVPMKEFSPNHMGVAAFDESTGKFLNEIPLGDNTRLLKQDWLKGYKEVNKEIIPESAAGLEGGRVFNTVYPQVITSPTTGLKQYGSTTLLPFERPMAPAGLIKYNNSKYADAALLPEDQVPYLLPQSEVMKRKPWLYQGKDDMIMESFKSNNKIAKRPYEIPASHNTQEDIMARALGKPLPTRASKASIEPKVYYDLNGTIINKPQ